MASYHRNYRDSLIFDQIKLNDTSIPAESFRSTPGPSSDETFINECSAIKESPSLHENSDTPEESKHSTPKYDQTFTIENSCNDRFQYLFQASSINDSNLSSPEILRKNSGTSIDFSSPEPLIRRIYRVNAPRDKKLASYEMDNHKNYESPDWHYETVSTPGSVNKRVVTSSVIVGKDADFNFDMSSIRFDEENFNLNQPISRFVDSKELISPILNYEGGDSVMEASPRDEIFTKKMPPLPSNIPSTNRNLVGLHDSAPASYNNVSKNLNYKDSFNSLPLNLDELVQVNTPIAHHPNKHRQYLASTFPLMTEYEEDSDHSVMNYNCTVVCSDSIKANNTTVLKSQDPFNPKSFNYWHKVIEQMELSATFPGEYSGRNDQYICDSYSQTIPTDVYPKKSLLNQPFLSVEEEESIQMQKLMAKLFIAGYEIKKKEN